MAYVLSLSASSPLRETHHSVTSHGYHGIGKSCSSTSSGGTARTVQHHRLRNLSSGSSLSSLTSLVTPAFRRHDEHGTASGSSSSHNLTLCRFPTSSDRRSLSNSAFSRRTSLVSVLSSRRRSDPLSFGHNDEVRLRNVVENDHEAVQGGGDELGFVEEDTAVSEIHNTSWATPQTEGVEKPLTFGEFNRLQTPKKSAPRRWLSTLRRRKPQEPILTTPTERRFPLDDFDSRPPSPEQERPSYHKKSESCSSSLRLVTAVRSATATLASMSIATVSRGNVKWRHVHRRSSVISDSDPHPRPSIDTQRSVMDEAAKQRSRKRRDKLEELIRSEESYVADLKTLLNAYFTILSHQSTAASFARSPARENISDILRLHDDLLGQLHRLVPFAEYDQRTAKAIPEVTLIRAHTRWHSVDAVPARSSPARSKLTTIRQGRRSLNISRSSEQEHSMLRCSPDTIAVVAKMFLSHIAQFSLYEEFGANYDLVLRDIEEVQRAILSWADFDRAIEALSAHVNPVRSREANQKKAMTVKDLLIKPVQRLPRYELLFGDLCKLTPVCDDPDVNATIRGLLVRLGDTCHKVNQAKENPIRARALEATWLLGDRLSFSKQVPKSIFHQLLGQVNLCGCLYIAYRGKSVIKGRYAICVLFDSTLLLGSADNDQSKYSTLAGIPLANTTLVEADNGKGLQCYTAPHCWKIVFEHSARMYEVIMTACSATEADVWREQLANKVEAQIRAVADGVSSAFELQSPLIAEMRSVGKAFGKPGSFVRRMSVHRTATVGPTTDLNQVIIKNTQAVKEAVDNTSHTSLQIPRSQSVATPSRVQTLAPRRADRIRLESLLSDVWTRDLLPYPGMHPRLSDPIRASANHVIRKFSMASITSNFSSSKRSASYTSISQSSSRRGKEDIAPPLLQPHDLRHGPRPTSSSSSSRQKAPRQRPSPVVDFHTAPEAFLPADFDLQDHPSTKRKRPSAFRTLTLTKERPFSPFLGLADPKTPSGLRRAQSVHGVHRKTAAATSVPPAERGERKKGVEAAAQTPVYSVAQGQRARTPVGMAMRERGSEKSDGTVVPEVEIVPEEKEDGRGVKEATKKSGNGRKGLLRLFG